MKLIPGEIDVTPQKQNLNTPKHTATTKSPISLSESNKKLSGSKAKKK